MHKKIAIFSLQTFSTTGGIQKMTRTLAHSMHTLARRNKWDFCLWSVYDTDADIMPQYLPATSFKGFMGDRYAFILSAIKLGMHTDVIIISHINMAIIGLAIKIINPKCKVMLIAHGIEVWRPLTLARKMFLNLCEKVICVSSFTRADLIKRHKVSPKKCIVINNAIDPLMQLPVNFTKPSQLLDRYKLTVHDDVLFTLTRLAATEQYKGYDQVLKVLARIRSSFPDIKYLLSGQYDLQEQRRIEQIVNQYDIKDQVILTGFVAEEELTDHFLLADVFVLPSKKEGFGIVFIEALACGLPVICGNADGSLDAIKHGKLGKAVDPDDLQELENAILDCLKNRPNMVKKSHLQQECLAYFNEDSYIAELEKLF